MSDTVIDIEMAYLPEPTTVRDGLVVFHTQEGRLYRLVKGAWKDKTPELPEGKFWFTPSCRIMEWDGTAWQQMQ